MGQISVKIYAAPGSLLSGNQHITGTARIHGKSAIEAIRELTEGRFAIA
jgi:uncharacterized protein (DUF2141 family)